MWNPFKTLAERDSARLRRIEATIDDLTADIERCLTSVDRLNARLRQRARRAAEAGDGGGDSDGGSDDRPEFVAPLGGSEPSQFESVASSNPSPDLDRSSLRGQLRSRARQRGLLPQLPSQRQ